MAVSVGPRAVTIVARDRRAIAGSYRISRGIITVKFGLGVKRAYVGGFAQYPEGLARLMLHELAVEAHE